MLYSGKCGPCQSLYGRETEESNPGYALSNQQYGSGNFSASGSSASYHSSPKSSSSIDDILPYQGMRSMPKITDGFYLQLGDTAHSQRQYAHIEHGSWTRMQMGYSMKSDMGSQYSGGTS